MLRSILFALFLLPFSAFAQELSKYDLNPCGAPSGLDPWLLDYKRDKVFVEDRSSDTLYVAIQIHLLAKDNGVGRFSANKTLDAFCRLNEDYKASRIQFYSKNDWNYIDSSKWYQHATLPLGIEMMLHNNVEGAANCYFVSDPAGNCGYNLPYAGMAVSHSCAAAGDHTWAHEMGHALSLPHPFFGWEKKTYNYNNPTPLELTVDYTYFHDTIDTQIPAPLDTALVEYLDGNNCQFAADLFCDTKADYLSYRWPCDQNGQSTTKQKDASGSDFYSDGTLFMSYSLDECSNRFSEDQISAMRANLIDKKSPWLTPGPTIGGITEIAQLLSPLNGDPAPSFGALVEWSPVPNATHYVLQVSRLANFAGYSEYVVKGATSYTLGQLTNNVAYFWRVRPFNNWYACTNWSESGKFQSVPSSGANTPAVSALRCFPTQLSPGAALTIEWGEFRQPFVQMELFNSLGQSVWNDRVYAEDTSRTIRMPENIPTGIYRLSAKGNAGYKVATLFIAK